ncbi:hypothetical protein QN277_018529 [Acacia crassicarpa]|uniref:tetraacyldisaccharide 4'-kinase n=1 Tax=Acacia crassicarpa TaxID=499986 RepID=A0AAE1JW18_9FABA|nr:hypothetical protein QN277_018529 [Acacia crassicarpa]
MEKLRSLVNEIAYSHSLTKLPPLQRSIVPFLSAASSLYKLVLSLRYYLYEVGFFQRHRLPIPVISVGNLTWGGNGKTPMVEFIALWFADCGISPLILSRGYGGGDEVNMLQRHLLGTAVQFGIGANRAAVASHFIKKYGYIKSHQNSWCEELCLHRKKESYPDSKKVGVAVLDDAMQHWSLWRDLEIVMVNGLTLWGNLQLMPLGPLREPLTALQRADVVVVHHADLVSEDSLEDIMSIVRKVKESVPMFFTRMDPSYLIDVRKINSKVPLRVLHKALVLCVSAIGSADSFVKQVQKIGAVHVDRVDFSDHHVFDAEDIEIIRGRLKELKIKFGLKPIVVVTEKDYDRDPEILKQLDPFIVFVLCSKLKVVPYCNSSEESFKKFLRDQLNSKFPAAN